LVVFAHSSPAAPSHNSKSHVALHVPPLQYCPAGQITPQAPQFAGSLATVLQEPEQFCWPTPHSTWQAPPLQNVPAAQMLPHTPQLF
jgi:hypothetical protein